jgi:hypothetical protein
MLLLLLWRHVVYYCEGRHINNPDLKASTTHAMRFLSSPDTKTFQVEAGVKLASVLQRLTSLDMVCLIIIVSLISQQANSFPGCVYDRERLAVQSGIH